MSRHPRIKLADMPVTECYLGAIALKFYGILDDTIARHCYMSFLETAAAS